MTVKAKKRQKSAVEKEEFVLKEGRESWLGSKSKDISHGNKYLKKVSVSGI